MKGPIKQKVFDLKFFNFRVLMSKAETLRTDDEKLKEEKLISRYKVLHHVGSTVDVGSTVGI